MAIDSTILKSFLSRADEVSKAALVLPMIESSPNFDNTNQHLNQEVKKLLHQLAPMKKSWQKTPSGFLGQVLEYDPVYFKIIDHFKNLKTKEELYGEDSLEFIEAFLKLFNSIDKLITVNNKISVEKEKRKSLLEESLNLLTESLGLLIGPLGDRMKDTLKNAVYRGSDYKALRKAMDSKLGSNSSNLRTLLHLDKNQDGSKRVDLGRQIKRQNDTLKALKDKRRKQKLREKKARKAGRKK